MSNELAVINNDLALMPVMDIKLAEQRRNQIVQFVRSIMVKDTDFGVIPGTDKPTLLKPGAEKLATFFGLSKRFQIIERSEDWTGQAHNGEAFFYYLYRCSLHRGDMLIAEADGSCSSFEAKYRWRDSKRVCPNCGQATIIKGKAEYGGGWLCYGKKGGCGAKFKTGDKAIDGQEVGRVANPDVADQVNTIQKMAQKRALIAATLLAVNASEFFTQDLEDYIDTEYTVEPEPKKQPATETKAENGTHGPVKESSNNQPAGKAKDKPYKFPSSASEKFFNAVQAATNNYYDNPPHLLNVIGGWFNFGNEDIWNEKLSMAVDHVREKREAEQAAEVETQDTEGQAEMFGDELTQQTGPGAAYQN